NNVMDQTFKTMESANLQGSDLVILAETAIPAFLPKRPSVAKRFKRKAQLLNTSIITGSLDYRKGKHPGRPYDFFNSAFLFLPDSTRPYHQYSKLRLVPFSERLPFDDIFPIINYVNLGEGDFSPGDGYRVWGTKVPYSPSICYEIVYPSFVRAVIKEGAKYLVNITNDGWFGNSPYIIALSNLK
ncbi:apolipoprotein N-acyltransferase, partial [bacterium]|nr:apolipoprotein N-acyltransferase [bacterium]